VDALGSVAAPSDSPAAALGPRPTRAAAARRAEFVDVWTRTDSKHRIRAYVMLALTFGLFCGLCVFTYWLRGARPLDFSWESYFAPARFWATHSPNLYDFVLYPVDVTRVPIHALVLGMLFASIVAVPVLIAILFRFASALPFVAAVGVFGHMPWLAFTLVGCCIIAAVPPLRLNFRFGSALLGMMPILLYMWLATRGTTDQLDQASPIQKSLLAIPWILAVLAACAMHACVLLISHAASYRPWAVSAVVAVMFATPVVLFHSLVGVDELAFRVLERDFGPKSPRFAPLSDAEPLLRDLFVRFVNDEAYYTRFRPEILEALAGDAEPVRRIVRQQMLLDHLTQRAAGHEACKRFIADHPRSRYIPAVLYMQARIMDTRLDERRFDPLSPRRELYADFPHVQSESAWAALLSEHADSRFSVAAATRLAELALRRGETAEALRLARVATRSQYIVSARSATSQPEASLLRAMPAEDSLGYDARPYVLEARRLADLIAANDDDPRFGSAPLAALASLDPRRPGYANALEDLMLRYPGAKITDNVRVARAVAEPLVEARMDGLAQLVAGPDDPDGDGVPEALLRLAEFEVQSAAAWRRPAGVGRLREIVRRFGDSCWAAEARERLAVLAPLANSESGPQ
jgi:hypothetical protein